MLQYSHRMTINEFKDKAQKSIDHFVEKMKTIRTGRANPSLIEGLPVDAYGSRMPLVQVSSISAPEPRLLTVSVWDQSLVEGVVQALKQSDLGVNPSVDGNLIRINLPIMTEERRAELSKVVGKYEEEAKVALRNHRRDFLDDVKRREKEEKLPEAVVKSEEEKIEQEIKKLNEQISSLADGKRKELMEM